MNSAQQAEVQEARELGELLDDLWADWDWGDDDELPTIDATPLRVSFLEAFRSAPQQSKGKK